MKENVIAVIPARGGSKGFPGKNIRSLAGKPLIAYSIEAALACKLIDRVILSTDNLEIAKVAKQFGAEVPFIRPKELAQDNSPTEPVLQHAVEWLEKNENYKTDIVIFLQPTDLFRKQWMVEAVVKRLLDDKDLDSVFVAYKTHKNFWRKVKGKYIKLAADIPYGPRKNREHLFREDTGIACATRAKFIKAGKRLGNQVDIVETDYGYTFIDIHDPFDFWLAEKVIEERRIKPNAP